MEFEYFTRATSSGLLAYKIILVEAFTFLPESLLADRGLLPPRLLFLS